MSAGGVPVWDEPRVASGRDRQLQALDRLLGDGAELVGWKVGVGSPAAMARAGISGPLVGYLTSATVLDDGAAIAVGTWRQPVFEAELAIHVGTDVAGDASPREIAAAVAGIGPAIELADVDVPLEDVEEVVAGNVFHRHVVLGEPDRGRGVGDVEDLRIRVTQGGDDVASTDEPTVATGDLLTVLAHVVAWLDAAGRRLSAGEVVIAGSTVPLVPVRPGDELTYRCDPLGTLGVSVRREADGW